MTHFLALFAGITCISSFADAIENKDVERHEITRKGIQLLSSTSWSELSPTTSPQPRSVPNLCCDIARRELFLFGGSLASGQILNDFWKWDGATWTKLSSENAPPARYSASMEYDPVSGKVVLFGGYSTAGLLADTWLWDGTEWTELSTDMAPNPRYMASLAIDPTSGKLLLFGGMGLAGCNNDTWLFTGSTWQEIIPQNSPPPRAAASMSMHGSSELLILSCGLGQDFNYRKDTWIWNGSDWTQGEDLPGSARGGACCTYDPIRDAVILFGGTTRGSMLNDTYSFDGTSWTEIATTTTPSPRSFSSLSYDLSSQQLILFGGTLPTNAPINETWMIQ